MSIMFNICDESVNTLINVKINFHILVTQYETFLWKRCYGEVKSYELLYKTVVHINIFYHIYILHISCTYILKLYEITYFLFRTIYVRLIT